MSHLVFRPHQPGASVQSPDARLPPPFSATWTETKRLLRHEVDMLNRDTPIAVDPIIVVEIDTNPSEIRQDGMMRADAKVNDDLVAVSFDSIHGPLRYECDRFRTGGRGATRQQGWQANVRAVALGLEALRKVERYGIGGSGEQYTGWQQLPSPASSQIVETPHDAAVFLMKVVERVSPIATMTYQPADIVHDPRYRSEVSRLARRATHPDTGGTAAEFRRVQRAIEVLTINDKETTP